MSKYKINQIVNFSNSPKLYVVIHIEEDIGEAVYKIMPKSKYDLWVPENLETYDSNSIIENVHEEKLSEVFL